MSEPKLLFADAINRAVDAHCFCDGDVCAVCHAMDAIEAALIGTALDSLDDERREYLRKKAEAAPPNESTASVTPSTHGGRYVSKVSAALKYLDDLVYRRKSLGKRGGGES
jgi:hypothetical protein